MAYVVKNPKLLNIFKFSFDDTVWKDTIFTGTTDEQLEDLLEFVAKKSIVNLSADESYEILLIGKREIYWKLATASAPLYSIEVDGTKVNKDQRFDHYFKLITELENTIKTDVVTSISVGDMLLSNRHFDSRNYANTPNPLVNLNIDNTLDTKLEISWSAEQVTKFHNYIIYISNTKDIIDSYRDKGLGSFHVAREDANLVSMIWDIKQTKYRIEGLTPNTKYYVAVVCFNANTVYGYDEVEVTTGVI